MKSTITTRLILLVALLTGVLMATATLRALAAEPPTQENTPATNDTTPDINNPEIPPLETGGPAGPIVFAEESNMQI